MAMYYNTRKVKDVSLKKKIKKSVIAAFACSRSGKKKYGSRLMILIQYICCKYSFRYAD